MPLATRTDLESVRGPYWVKTHIDQARDPGSTTAEQEDQAEARLNAALQAGDEVIKRYLPLPDPLPSTDEQYSALKQIAIEYALYFLVLHSKQGPTEAQEMAAQRIELNLAKMRERGQWPGSAKRQANLTSGYVPSTSAWSRSKLGGLI